MSARGPTPQQPGELGVAAAPAFGHRWRPWRELRHLPDVAVLLVDFPAGPVQALCVIRGATRIVLIDRELRAADRRAALTHELVHLERGPVPGEAPTWVVAKEERHVDRIAARRLVPAGELRRFVEAMTTIGPVSALDVAEQFEVSLPVAIRACEELGQAR
jgi:Zn-dependent peptidase ImmA (M78 family)